MKFSRVFAVFGLCLALIVPTLMVGQAINVYNVNGVFNPAAYGAYKLYSASTVPAAAATMTVIKNQTGVLDPNADCYVSTLGPGSVRFLPLQVNVKLSILDSASEVVTVTAVNNTAGSCSFTATFGNAHNPGALIQSATNGMLELIALSPPGVYAGQTSELITLATGATTTDSTNNLLPANSMIDMVQGTVNTTITTGCTCWQLGTAATAGRFSASDTTLTAGETIPSATYPPVFQGTGIASATTGQYQAAAAKVRITCATAAPGAGKVRVTVFYHIYVPPTS